MKKLTKKIILLLFFCVITCVNAQKSYNLEGKINEKYKIIMNITDYSDNSDENYVSAKYCYENSLKDIVLEGTKTNNVFYLHFDENFDDKYEEEFILSEFKNNTINGNWIDKNGKKHAVELKKINSTNIINPYKYANNLENLKIEDSYNYKKVSLLSFLLDSTSVYKNQEINWYSEKHCKSVMFMLKTPSLYKAGTKINQHLKEIHVFDVLNQLNCSSKNYYSNGDGIEFGYNLTFFNKNLLAFTGFQSYYCGGAHPDFGSQGYLFDLHSGKQYQLNDIIYFGNHKPKVVTTQNFSKTNEDELNVFANTLTKLMIKVHQFEKPETEDDYCDYTEPEYWRYPSWSYTTEGIAFTPHFFRAARSCEDAFLIPFSELSKYRNLSFPYKF